MTNIPPKMSLQHYLSSAQQLLNLAHAQAQQMLSLAYQQAQQVLLNCDQAPQIKPPPLMSVCKAHNHPACSRVPCSQILYNQSKVTCHQLQAELIKRSKRPRTKATKTQSVKQARINELGYPAPQPSTIKRSRSFPTFPPGLEPLMGEGKHPIKPTCVIKTPRTAATSQILTLPKQSMAKPDEGDAAAKEEPILEASFNIKQGSLMAEQPGAPSAPNPPPIPYIGAAALAQGGGPQPTGNHFKPDSVANSPILMSGMAASSPAPSLATGADYKNTHASTCTGTEPSGLNLHVKLPSALPSLSLSSALLSTKLSSNVHTTSHVSAGEFSVPKDPAQIAAWFDEDFTPSHFRHQNTPLSYGHLTHSVLIPLGSTRGAKTNIVRSWCPLCQANAYPHNHKVSQCPFLSKDDIQAIVQAEKVEAGCGSESEEGEEGEESEESEECEESEESEEGEEFEPLEVPDLNILRFAQEEYDWDDVLEAVSTLDCKGDQISALKLFSDLLNSEVSGMDHTQAALLRRNCARLHILLHQPAEALALCTLNFQVDGEDVQTKRISRRACNAIKELEGGWRISKLRTP